MPVTLVLNADYTPLSIIPVSAISWKDAVKIVFLGTATTVDHYDNWHVRSPSVSINVPSVIVSREFIKKKQSVRFSRTNLLIRDNFTCQYCDATLTSHDLTIDHVVPRVKGGKTKWDNVVCACYVCNSIKGHKSTMKPKKRPVRPDYYQLVDNVKKMKITVPSKTWLPYLGWDPKLVTVVDPNRN